eukprot:14118648-Alexandrium_andersonii.AAC.1
MTLQKVHGFASSKEELAAKQAKLEEARAEQVRSASLAALAPVAPVGGPAPAAGGQPGVPGDGLAQLFAG